jgi:hypothetical protein
VAEPLQYLGHYPASLRNQVRALISSGRLGEYVHTRYPNTHAIGSDAALYTYVNALKREHMAKAPPLNKVAYCNKISTLHHALGINKQASRVQGGRLESKREIRVASVFRTSAPEFLEAIVVHELAHLREREHDKPFYRLCEHMLPDYHQIEFDMRVWLTWRELEGKRSEDDGRDV